MKNLYLLIIVIAFCGLNETIAQWSTSGNNIYNTNTGNVGIGTNTPSSLLYVAKNMTEPTISIRNLGGSGGATYTMIDDASGANWKFKATLSGGFKIRDHANSLDVIVVEPASMANALYVKAGGGVGIGTASPSSLLEVAGRNIELADYVFLGRMYSGTDLLLGHNMKAIDDANTRGAVVANNWSGGYSGIRMYNGDIQFHTQGGQVFAGDPASNLRMRITSTGNIGIGTSSPASTALVEMASTSKGFLPPRMTSEQLAAIVNPADGLMVYNNSDKHFYYYTTLDNKWVRMARENEGGAWSCGSSITVLHNAGDVAPVSKLVTYGTIAYLLGETSLCWITQNLGADHQATSVDDATEASSGWYWQFNRKQGYKHDGTNRTPNTTWISSINENSDWLSGNDPCTIVFGSGWRLPTYLEWDGVDISEGWTNWNGPWNSDLKIHAAGRLYFNDGSLNGRGYYGYYWSSKQYNDSFGWLLRFDSSLCDMIGTNKSNGFPVRCVRE